MAIDMIRLQQAVEKSRSKLRPFREKRRTLVSEYAGSTYTSGDYQKDNHINLLKSAIDIHAMRLCGGEPKAQVYTPRPSLKADAENLSLALDHLAREINLRDTLHRLVVDSLFSIGIAKIGIAPGRPVEIMGVLHDSGQPYVDVVSLDDWVHDTNAKTWEGCEFMGNRYNVRLDDLKNDPSCIKKNVDKLHAYEPKSTNEDGDSKTKSVEIKYDEMAEDYVDHIDLWDIYLPREKKILTFAAEENGSLTVSSRLGSDKSGDPPNLVRDVDWKGPENGCYRILGLSKVPDALMPLPPAAGWFLMHQNVNAQYRKLQRQAQRQKSIGVVPYGAAGDAQRIIDSSDGQVVTIEGTNPLQSADFGGPNQTCFAFMLHGMQTFKWLANNLDTLGGLGTGADTLGQENLLDQNSGRMIRYMTDQVYAVVNGIYSDMAWHLYYNPLIEIPMTKPIPGTDMEISFDFSPDDLEGDFLDYNFQIRPYSLQPKSPEQRGAIKKEILGNFLLPAAPIMAQQNMGLDFQKIVKSMSEDNDIPELVDFVTQTGDMNPADEPIGQPPSRVGSTTHNYTRKGEAQTTPDEQMMQSMLQSGGAKAAM